MLVYICSILSCYRERTVLNKSISVISHDNSDVLRQELEQMLSVLGWSTGVLGFGDAIELNMSAMCERTLGWAIGASWRLSCWVVKNPGCSHLMKVRTNPHFSGSEVHWDTFNILPLLDCFPCWLFKAPSSSLGFFLLVKDLKVWLTDPGSIFDIDPLEDNIQSRSLHMLSGIVWVPLCFPRFCWKANDDAL